MGLFDEMGGREWVRRVGASLSGPTTSHEVHLILPDGTGPNRVTVEQKRKGGEAKVLFGRVEGDESEDMGAFPARGGAEAAKLIEELVAASKPKGRAAKEVPTLEPAEV